MRPKRRRQSILFVAIALFALAATALAIPPVRRAFHPLVVRVRGKRTVEHRLAEFTETERRLRDGFARADVSFPPSHVVLLALKDERRVEVYAGPSHDALRKIAAHPILAASGSLGPKLREGDGQVPEGVYALESLNPDSKFHVALRVGYPNDLDRELAARHGRSHLGGDIMIHGGRASIGCLAMGDDVAEELFILAARAGVPNVTIVIAPLDLRTRQLPTELRDRANEPRYAEIQQRIGQLPR